MNKLNGKSPYIKFQSWGYFTMLQSPVLLHQHYEQKEREKAEKNKIKKIQDRQTATWKVETEIQIGFELYRY